MLLAVFGIVFAATFLGEPGRSGGWFWEFGNGIGYAAYAAVIYQFADSRKIIDRKLHEWNGYVVAILIVFHALWLLLGDAAVVDYLRPGAPAYMWAGLVSLVTLVPIVLLARMPERRKFHRDRLVFRTTHRWLSILLLAGAAWHIIAAGFYLPTELQTAIIGSAAIAAAFVRVPRIKAQKKGRLSTYRLITVSTASVVLFAVLRNVAW